VNAAEQAAESGTSLLTLERTLTRDVNALVEMGLIRRTVKGYEPNRDVIRAFLPVRSGGD
jgi:DNA-binding HxlR family transcriptional regulator